MASFHYVVHSFLVLYNYVLSIGNSIQLIAVCYEIFVLIEWINNEAYIEIELMYEQTEAAKNVLKD